MGRQHAKDCRNDRSPQRLLDVVVQRRDLARRLGFQHLDATVRIKPGHGLLPPTVLSVSPESPSGLHVLALDQLEKYAVGAAWVDKRDQAMDSTTRLTVDEF